MDHNYKIVRIENYLQIEGAQFLKRYVKTAYGTMIVIADANLPREEVERTILEGIEERATELASHRWNQAGQSHEQSDDRN